MGTDLQYVYGDERHFPDPGITEGILLGLLGVYIASLLGIEDIAEDHRKQLVALVKKLHRNKVKPDDIANIKDDVNTLFDERNQIDDEISETNEFKAIEQGTAALCDMGVPPKRAEKLSPKISATVRDSLEKDNS